MEDVCQPWFKTKGYCFSGVPLCKALDSQMKWVWWVSDSPRELFQTPTKSSSSKILPLVKNHCGRTGLYLSGVLSLENTWRTSGVKKH